MLFDWSDPDPDPDHLGQDQVNLASEGESTRSTRSMGCEVESCHRISTFPQNLDDCGLFSSGLLLGLPDLSDLDPDSRIKHADV